MIYSRVRPADVVTALGPFVLCQNRSGRHSGKVKNLLGGATVTIYVAIARAQFVLSLVTVQWPQPFGEFSDSTPVRSH